MKKIYLQSFGEEVANAVSHGVMAFLALLFIYVASVVAFAAAMCSTVSRSASFRSPSS